MLVFGSIFIKIILPIFILIMIGFIAQKKLGLDTGTLSKAMIYIFIPAVIFIKIYYAKITIEFFGLIFLFIFGIQFMMFLIGEIAARLLGYSRGKRKAFGNALYLFNSGNYGLPIAEMVFRTSAIAASVQVFIMLIQNISGNTAGVFQASSANSSYKKALVNVMRMPSFYVLGLVIFVNYYNIVVPDQFIVPLKYLSDGFIGIALVMLGAQLAEIDFSIKIQDVFLPCFIRLIISPLLGLILALALGLHGEMAQALIIGVSTPTAINTVILAKEYDNEPEYASKVVFLSTLLSAVSISAVIYLVTRYL